MAWKPKRSFAIVAMQEWPLHPVPQRCASERSGTIATEVAASDVVYTSRPAAVAAVAERATNATH